MRDAQITSAKRRLLTSSSYCRLARMREHYGTVPIATHRHWRQESNGSGSVVGVLAGTLLALGEFGQAASVRVNAPYAEATRQRKYEPVKIDRRPIG